jgi:hypothetical protein
LIVLFCFFLYRHECTSTNLHSIACYISRLLGVA